MNALYKNCSAIGRWVKGPGGLRISTNHDCIPRSEASCWEDPTWVTKLLWLGALQQQAYSRNLILAKFSAAAEILGWWNLLENLLFQPRLQRCSHTVFTPPDFHKLQPNTLQQRPPLLLTPFHSAQNHHVQIQSRLLRWYIPFRQNKISYHDSGLLWVHCTDGILQYFTALIVRPVMEDSVKVIYMRSYEKVSVLRGSRVLYTFDRLRGKEIIFHKLYSLLRYRFTNIRKYTW